MFPSTRPGAARRGAIAPLTALLLIPLLAMVAFGVDLGYIVLVKTELQHTADAASLAGAQQLMTPYTLWVVASTNKNTIRANAITAAKQAAKTYATYNQAGQVNISLLDQDIEVGFVDANGNYDPNPPTTTFPNTVRVLARRDGQQNTSVSLFFACVLGTPSEDLTASARATIYTADIDSLKSTSSKNIRMLPVTYDMHDWDNFVRTGKNSDGNTALDASGNPQLQVYPSIQNKGNFGELALDDSHAGASEIRGWVDSGLNGSSVQTLVNNGLIPLSRHQSLVPDWLGDPGLKDSVIQDINSHAGQTYILPLYTPVTDVPYVAGIGEGSHFNYTITRFVTVKVMPNGNGGVVVEPNGYVDPAAVFKTSTITPAGTDTRSFTVTTLTAPKLSQ
jgi:Flp pilus assembly protein TadG